MTEAARRARYLDEIRRSLVRRRGELRITQREVAERMETAQSHVSDMEAGRVGVSVTTLARWVAALDLEVELTLGGDEIRWRVVPPGEDHSDLLGSSRENVDERTSDEVTSEPGALDPTRLHAAEMALDLHRDAIPGPNRPGPSVDKLTRDLVLCARRLEHYLRTGELRRTWDEQS